MPAGRPSSRSVRGKPPARGDGEGADRAAWSRPALFRVDEVPADGELVLNGDEGRHAADVRRVRPGEVVLVGDGEGARARAEVLAVAARTVTLRVLERRDEPPPAPRVVLVQALVKGDRGELAVETATEAGVDGIVPWRAARSIARWDDGPRGAKALGRWRSTAREAAKQSRRARVPAVEAPHDTAALAARVTAADAALLLEATATTSLADVDLPADGEILLVVGPEGGIDDAELATLTAAGAVPVAMGPTVLRTSTAAAVALGALGVRTGRWAP